MKLRSFGAVLWQRRFLIAGVIVVALLCVPILTKMIAPTYEATSEVSYVGSGSAGNTISLSNAILPTSDLPQLVLSYAVIADAKQALNLHDSVDELRLTTSVKASPHSNVVPIVVRMKDRSNAVLFANALADSTVHHYKEIAARQYDDVISHIRAQLDGERNEIRTIDASLQQAVQLDSFVGSSDALDTISKHLDDLEVQRGTAYATYVADRAAASAQASGTSDTDRAGLASAIHEQVLTNDLTYQAVKTAQSKDVAELAATRAGYTDSFPGLPGLVAKVKIETKAADQAAQQAISEHPGNSATYAQVVLNEHNAAALASGDKARVTALDHDISIARSRLSDLPHVGVRADLLRLQRDSASAAYTALDTRYQQTLADRAQAAALGAAFVLDHATMAAPRIPELAIATVLAALILLLAIGVAYAAEALDPRIRTAADVEDLYGMPRIGSV